MRIGLGMGSNEGDRLEALRQARLRICKLPGVSKADVLCGPIYETDPIGCPPGSGAFLNTVMEVGVNDATAPTKFLADLREIERALGRPARYPRNAPRTVDLDILYAGNFVVNVPSLTLPHPRLARRRFVLAPLAAIRPALVLPGQNKPVVELLHELDDPARVIQINADW